MTINAQTKQWDRLGSLQPESLTGDSKKLYQDIVTYFKTPYVYKLDDNTLIGPFGIELHTPGAGYAWLHMTQSLAAITQLKPTAREVAILVTGIHENSAYEMYAHDAVSALSKQDLDTLHSGKCPEHLGEDVQIAWKVATALCTIPGPLSTDLWQESVKVLGREAAIAVVHYVGFYKYISTILNGFDAKIPDSV